MLIRFMLANENDLASDQIVRENVPLHGQVTSADLLASHRCIDHRAEGVSPNDAYTKRIFAAFFTRPGRELGEVKDECRLDFVFADACHVAVRGRRRKQGRQ